MNKETREQVITCIDQAKFRDFFTKVLDADQYGGQGLSSFKFVPINLKDHDLMYKLAGEIWWTRGWQCSWFFQYEYIPESMNRPKIVKEIFKERLRNCCREIRKRADILENLKLPIDRRSFISPFYKVNNYYIPSVFDGRYPIVPEEKIPKYYFLCNIHSNYLFSNDAFKHAKRVFKNELGLDLLKSPEFGIGTARTISQNEQTMNPHLPKDFIDRILLECINRPSSIYFISREGQIDISYVTNLGLFYSSDSSSMTIRNANAGISTTLSKRADETRYRPESIISEFRHLINSRSVKEKDIQIFLEEFPEILKSLDENYCEIRPHVCLTDKNSNELIPDFMARVNNSEIWDIIELKLPQSKIFLNREEQFDRRASVDVAKAVIQLKNYYDFFERKENRDRILKTYGIHSYRPSLVLVLGRDKCDYRYEWKNVKALWPNVRIVPYDYLLHRYERLCAILKDINQ